LFLKQEIRSRKKIYLHRNFRSASGFALPQGGEKKRRQKEKEKRK
jgi:hypothetical protein